MCIPKPFPRGFYCLTEKSLPCKCLFHVQDWKYKFCIFQIPCAVLMNAYCEWLEIILISVTVNKFFVRRISRDTYKQQKINRKIHMTGTVTNPMNGVLRRWQEKLTFSVWGVLTHLFFLSPVWGEENVFLKKTHCPNWTLTLGFVASNSACHIGTNVQKCIFNFTFVLYIYSKNSFTPLSYIRNFHFLQNSIALLHCT